MNIIDFTNVKQLKQLGTGVFGTTYLALYNNKKYALKIQNILPVHRKKNYKYELWRELDLYNYINSLNSSDRKFFTQLYAYEIYDDCKHKQIRPFKINKNNKFSKKLKKLDESNWCVRLLLDYQGKSTLGKYIATHNLSVKQTYSFMFQIIKMILILYKGGYSHNDLHMYNIMIVKTNEKYFNFTNTKKIPYYGYQLIAIDFGNVIHTKFNIKYDLTNKLFKINREKWLFNEINKGINILITNIDKYIHNCKLQNKQRPGDKKDFHPQSNLVHNIIHKHRTFWNESKFEYNDNKHIEKLLNKIEKNKDKPFSLIFKNEKYAYYTRQVLAKIKNKFLTLYPQLYSKYYGWCSYHKINIPKNDYLTILKITNLKSLLKFMYSKI